MVISFVIYWAKPTCNDSVAHVGMDSLHNGRDWRKQYCPIDLRGYLAFHEEKKNKRN